MIPISIPAIAIGPKTIPTINGTIKTKTPTGSNSPIEDLVAIWIHKS